MPSNNFFFCAEKYTLSGWRKGVGWPHVRQSSAHLITRGKSSTKFGAVFTCGLETPTTLYDTDTMLQERAHFEEHYAIPLQILILELHCHVHCLIKIIHCIVGE